MRKKNDIFFIVNCLYTRPDYLWMLELDIDSLSAYTVYLWLSMSQDYRILSALSKIDKYMFVLSDFEQLLLLHATLPKTKKKQYNKFVKKEKSTDKLDFLYEQIQATLGYSDREFSHVKHHIEREVKTDVKKWLIDFGVEEKMYKKLGIEYTKNTNTKAPTAGVGNFTW